MLIKFCWSVVLLNSYILADFLSSFSVGLRVVLKFPTVIVELSVSPFSSISFCFTYFAALLLGAYTFGLAMSSLWIDPFTLYNAFLYLW